ncbi:MAG: hypothetical protein U0172_14045 [Nitrospiraceae bacterium]
MGRNLLVVALLVGVLAVGGCAASAHQSDGVIYTASAGVYAPAPVYGYGPVYGPASWYPGWGLGWGLGWGPGYYRGFYPGYPGYWGGGWRRGYGGYGYYGGGRRWGGGGYSGTVPPQFRKR